MDWGRVTKHVVREHPTPVLLAMISSATNFTSIASIGLGDLANVHDEADTVEHTDVLVPPEYVQTHVFSDGHLVMLT